jgi:hypothetical protein
MLRYAASNFCPTIDYCRNSFALLRFDEQTAKCWLKSTAFPQHVVDVDHRQRQYEQQLFWLLLLLRASPIIMGLPLAVNSASAAAP